MNQDHVARIDKLERRVNLLTWVVIIQVLAVAFELPLIPLTLLSVVVLLPILAFTHKLVPPLARRLGRLFTPASDLPKT